MFMKGAQITFGGLWKNVAPSPRRWFLITSSDVAEEIEGVFIPKIRKDFLRTWLPYVHVSQSFDWTLRNSFRAKVKLFAFHPLVLWES